MSPPSPVGPSYLLGRASLSPRVRQAGLLLPCTGPDRAARPASQLGGVEGGRRMAALRSLPELVGIELPPLACLPLCCSCPRRSSPKSSYISSSLPGAEAGGHTASPRRVAACRRSALLSRLAAHRRFPPSPRSHLLLLPCFAVRFDLSWLCRKGGFTLSYRGPWRSALQHFLRQNDVLSLYRKGRRSPVGMV